MKWLDNMLGWLGFRDRRRSTTIPPPRLRKRLDWDRPFRGDGALPRVPVELDLDATPDHRKPTVPRHARKRPPPHDRDKS